MSRLIKDVVLDRRTKNNSSACVADFVFCCNCGKTMLVDIGTDRCPECDEESLQWADEYNQEVTEEFFYNNEDYVLVDTES